MKRNAGMVGSVVPERSSILNRLYDFRHVAIPALVYTLELVVWAVLNHKGLGDDDWKTWRLGLLISLFLLFCTSFTFRKNPQISLAATGVLLPWFIMLGLIIIGGVIQMNLSFITISWFFAGVLGSGVLQAGWIIVFCVANRR